MSETKTEQMAFIDGEIWHRCPNNHRMAAFGDAGEMILVCPGCCRRWRVKEEYGDTSGYALEPWSELDL